MYNKILAPLDGSKLSECSLEHVKAICKGFKTPEVVLLTVVEEPLPFQGYASQQRIEEIKEEMKEIQKRAEDYLAKVASGLRKEGMVVHNTVIRLTIAHGVADAILDYVENNKIDLIIMSTHGRSGISRWAFGSVADKVVSHAKVPVLTITAAGCRGL
jgi:nucleotide-binding universal stress UspA family protein